MSGPVALTSLAFAGFLPCAWLLARLLGARLRWLAVLVASLAFVGSYGAAHVAIGVLVTLSAYSFGLVLGREGLAPRWRRLALGAGLVATLAPLFALKYLPFFAASLGVPGLPTFAALGLSYASLQGVSYLLDLYVGTEAAERHLGRFAVYMLFFAKVVQGPIERAGRFLPQLREAAPMSLGQLGPGLGLFAWGLFKKVVVADRLAPFVSAVYDEPSAYGGLSTVFATYLFAAQLLLDFSGYTDMARGTARLFALDLTENFRTPYLTTSIAEFWRGWHVSFSSWILDYVFKPLQLELRRHPRWGTPVALFVAFLVSGLWHGAKWTFVLWGALHGLAMATAGVVGPARRKLYKKLAIAGRWWLRPWIVLVNFHLVCLGWVFFRARSVPEALGLLGGSFSGLPRSLRELAAGDVDAVVALGQGRSALALAVGLLALVVALGLVRRELESAKDVAALAWPLRFAASPWARTVVAAVLFYLLAFHGAAAQGFVYAQF